jgi:hypothetical protein
MLASADSIADLQAVWSKIARHIQADARVIAAKDARKTELTKEAA